jgi:hypothetical protein
MTTLGRFSKWMGTVAALVAAAPLSGQRYGLREVRDVGRAGVHLALGVPVGDFRQSVNAAGGVNVFGAVNLDRAGGLALRLDGSYLVYGVDDRLVSQPYFPVGINTTYSIGTFGIGPQITLGQGPVRLYGFGEAGFSYISAHSSYRVDGCGCDAFASSTDFADWTSALQAGGGVLVSLRQGRTPVSLDLGARYLGNGEAWVVRPGDVVPQSDGSVVVYPTRTRADLVVFQLGVSVGLR